MSRHFTFTPHQHDVPVEVVEVLAERAREYSLPMVLIGAAARDLCVHAPLDLFPERATQDVDIALAVPPGDVFAEFTSGFEAVRGAEHKFIVLGTEVDIVPFDGVEEEGQVTFSDGSVLDVIGLREALAAPDLVTLSSRLTVRVASIQAQTALKILAWRDRHHINTKDAVDLHSLLTAGSEGPYAEEMWEAEPALTACGYVPDLAGAHLLGQRSGEAFTAQRGRAVIEVLDDPASASLLALQMKKPTSADLLDAYRRGFISGCPR